MSLEYKVQQNLEQLSDSELEGLDVGLSEKTTRHPDDSIEAILDAAGFTDLTKESPLTEIGAALETLRTLLCGVDPLLRALAREAALRKLQGIHIKSPAKILDAALKLKESEPEAEESALLFLENPEPWPKEVNGRELLEDIQAIIARFIVIDEEAKRAVSLWIVHAYALNAFDISPTLALDSPIKRSGKTTTLELISLLTPRALAASSITASVVYRAVEKYHPTLLVDEADTFLKDNEALQGILNSSHRKASAHAIRSHGDDHDPKVFSTWCAKAIALIGKLPGTLEDRSIVIHLKRKTRGDIVERFRPDRIRAECEILKRKAGRWCNDNLDALKASDPDVPDALHDRAADNWRPLFAIADLAGGKWPRLGREAARSLSGAIDEADESALVQLLTDLRMLFKDGDPLSSSTICTRLGDMEDRPWPEWRQGKPITPRQIARLLKPLGIQPKTIRLGEETPKGYERSALDDAFARYLGFSAATTPQSNRDGGLDSFSDPPQNPDVADTKTLSNPHKQRGVADVADENREKASFEGDSAQECMNWESI